MQKPMESRNRQTKKGNKIFKGSAVTAEARTKHKDQRPEGSRKSFGDESKRQNKWPVEDVEQIKKAIEYDFGIGTRWDAATPTWVAAPALRRFAQLSKDVEGLLRKIAPTEKSVAAAERCLSQLGKMLQPLSPHWDVMAFGSSANGFNTVSSDLDVTFRYDGYCPGDDVQQLAAKNLNQLLPMLEDHPAFSVKEQILHARIPILKLSFGEMLDVDLSCHNLQPLSNTRLLKAYSCIDRRVIDLCVAIKHWAREAGVCDAAKSKLSSYSFTLLVVYFMQVAPEVRLPILPVDEFDFHNQSDGAESISSARTWFKCELCLAELLSRFFAFYSNYESEGFAWGTEVASVRMGFRCAASEPMFAKLRGRSEHRFHIEDPYELERNLHSVLGKMEEEQLHDAFTAAYLQIRDGKTPKGLKCEDSDGVFGHEVAEGPIPEAYYTMPPQAATPTGPPAPSPAAEVDRKLRSRRNGRPIFHLPWLGEEVVDVLGKSRRMQLRETGQEAIPQSKDEVFHALGGSGLVTTSGYRSVPVTPTSPLLATDQKLKSTDYIKSTSVMGDRGEFDSWLMPGAPPSHYQFPHLWQEYNAVQHNAALQNVIPTRWGGQALMAIPMGFTGEQPWSQKPLATAPAAPVPTMAAPLYGPPGQWVGVAPPDHEPQLISR